MQSPVTSGADREAGRSRSGISGRAPSEVLKAENLKAIPFTCQLQVSNPALRMIYAEPCMTDTTATEYTCT